MLALAVLALVYLVTSYNKKENVNSGSLLGEWFSGDDEEILGTESFSGDPNEDPLLEDFAGNQSVEASEPMGQNAVYQTLNADASGNQHPKDCPALPQKVWFCFFPPSH